MKNIFYIAYTKLNKVRNYVTLSRHAHAVRH